MPPPSVKDVPKAGSAPENNCVWSDPTAIRLLKVETLAVTVDKVKGKVPLDSELPEIELARKKVRPVMMRGPGKADPA